MKPLIRNIVLLPAIMFLITACSGPDVLKDLGDRSFQLINQDSSIVNFPVDFKGDLLVIGFIYTNCPDVCPAITANMTNVQRKLDDDTGVRFIGITFDPERDSPAVLSQYMNLYNVSSPQWTFLTGDSSEIDSLMSDLGILVRRSDSDSTKQVADGYYITHTNRITLVDRKGRIRAEYPGSFASPERIVKDIRQLR